VYARGFAKVSLKAYRSVELMAVVENVGGGRHVTRQYVREHWVRKGKKRYRYGVVVVTLPEEWVGRYVRVLVELEEGRD